MHYADAINEILKSLQTVTVVATYGNTKTMSTCFEQLAAIADELKNEPESKENAINA